MISAPQKLFLFQLIAHLSLVPMIIYASFEEYLISFIVYFFTGCFGMTMTYHRLLSHRSWQAPRWFWYFGTLCAVFGLTGSPIAWAAVHREHHRFSDTDKDPHCPERIGFLKAQWGSMFCPVKVKYVTDLLKDRFLLFIHKHYFKINMVWALICFLIEPFAVVYLYLFPAFLLWNMGSFIITLTHMFGYEVEGTPDKSKNIFFLGYLLWGEGWHANHHKDPNNPVFSNRWWELDLGGVFIRIISRN